MTEQKETSKLPAGATIGFIGTGDMGGPMALNLLRAGYRVAAYDLAPERLADLTAAGARIAESVDEVAREATVIMCCVNSTKALLAIGETVAQHSACKVFIDHSTSGPSAAAQLASQLDSAGIAMLDAPISGMVHRAQDGTLSIMVSGPEAAYALAQPLLDVIGAHVFYLGDTPGAGQMMKVANNLINNVQTLATCEALAMGIKFGLEPSQMFDILNVSTGRNSQTDGQLRGAVLENDFSKGAVMTISQKDITLAVDEAHTLGVLAATAEVARDVINSALAAGGAEQRSSNIFRYVASASGVSVE
jgi:2-hydroxy-3-oxopropionate reductase